MNPKQKRMTEQDISTLFSSRALPARPTPTSGWIITLCERISTLLIFAGYGIVAPRDYAKFKRRLKSLYGLRSRAIHRAEFNLVENADLEEFSFWVAWMIVSMVALAERGYRTLAVVKDQVLRLDAISTRVGAAE